MRLKVVSHVKDGEYLCRDSDGKEIMVDLYVGAKKGVMPVDVKSVVGKTVEAEWLQAYLYLANNTEVVE